MWVILLRKRLDQFTQSLTERSPVWRLARAAGVLLDIIQQLQVDASLRTAAALSFTTILAVVPFLAVSFAIFQLFSDPQQLAAEARTLLTDSGVVEADSALVTSIEDFVLRVKGRAIGFVGFFFLLVTSISLFMSVEQAFNRVWRVPRSRAMYRRLLTFYAVVTLTPGLIALSVMVTRGARNGVSDWPALLAITGALVPLLITGLALTLIYKLLPHTPVRWRAALIGGLCAGLAFELGKWGFDAYVTAIWAGSVKSRIYGSMALLPVFFLLVYICWIIVLGGTELAYLVQNHGVLTAEVRARRGRARGALPPPPTTYLVIRVFADIALRFRNGGGGSSTEAIAAALQIPVDEARPAISLLKQAQLVMGLNSDQDQVLPAKPLAQVRLSEIAKLCQNGGYLPGELPSGPATARLEAHLEAAEHSGEEALDIDIASLID